MISNIEIKFKGANGKDRKILLYDVTVLNQERIRLWDSREKKEIELSREEIIEARDVDNDTFIDDVISYIFSEKTKNKKKNQRNQQRDKFLMGYGVRAIGKFYLKKLEMLFEDKCFNCGSKNVLQIDHHIPFEKGGLYAPGNLVVLCRRCNSSKADQMPEEFYAKAQLRKLRPLLAKEAAVLAFDFDEKQWLASPEKYLLHVGIDPETVHRVLHDEMYRDYAGWVFERNPLSVTLTVDGIYEADHGA